MIHDSSIKRIVKEVFGRVNTGGTYNDIILSDWIKANKDLIGKAHQLKCTQMKLGELWQRSFSLVEGIHDLGKGHPSKLDVISDDKFHTKFIMELKNSYRTDNSSSRSKNYDKLVTFVAEHRDYIPIYGVINCDTSDNSGRDYEFYHRGYTIRYLSGYRLLRFIFGDRYRDIKSKLVDSVSQYLD